MCNRSFASGSWSTMRVRGVCITSAALARQRHPQRDEKPAAIRPAPFAAGRRAIAGQQPFAHIVAAEPGPRLWGGGGGADIIFDPQHEQTIFMARGKADADFPLPRSDAVLDRIPDPLLPDWAGHHGNFRTEKR